MDQIFMIGGTFVLKLLYLETAYFYLHLFPVNCDAVPH